MIPLDILLVATSVLSLSSDATAPTLFIIRTNSVDPPLHSIASVSNTWKGMLHVLLVINSNTQTAYSCRMFLVFGLSESTKRLHLLSRTESVRVSINLSRLGLSCFLNVSMLKVDKLSGLFLYIVTSSLAWFCSNLLT